MRNLCPTRIALSMGLVVALLCATSCGGNMSPAGDFAVIFPSSAIVPMSGSVDSTLQFTGAIRALNGFDGTIALAITGVPNGVALTLAPAVSAPGIYTMTLNVSSDVAPGTYTITFLFTSGHLQHTSTLELQVIG
jgi:hypothetical protein